MSIKHPGRGSTDPESTRWRSGTSRNVEATNRRHGRTTGNLSSNQQPKHLETNLNSRASYFFLLQGHEGETRALLSELEHIQFRTQGSLAGKIGRERRREGKREGKERRGEKSTQIWVT